MPPPRKPFSPAHTAVRQRLARARARTKHVLTEQQVRTLEERMGAHFGWHDGPRPFQVDGVKAQLEGEDAIIQAPTGAGKTAIVAGPYTMPELLGKRTITIMVVPLLALQEEMERTFSEEFNLSAVAVNSAHGLSTPGLVRDLRKGRYNVILISPEMLQSRAFVDRVLRHQEFSSRVLSIVVDEAHCISHWGSNFRKKYASLGTTRAFLPRGTPVIAVTATLTARVRRDLQHKLHFPQTGGLFFNAGNDRPNVSIVVRALEHAQNTFADLDFVIPNSICRPSDIPKTYIYADDIKVGTGIVDHLNTLIKDRCRTVDGGLVRPYNATLSASYRTEAMKQFRQGGIRVLVCTDAAGMGCNVSDVDVVVQWKMPKSLSQFVQRAGRAARRRDYKGLSVLLVERSAYSTYLDDDSKATASGPHSAKTKLPADSKTKAPKGYATARGIHRGGTKHQDTIVQPPLQPPIDLESADEALLVFVQTTLCRRQVWLSMFDGSVMGTDTRRPVPCCDICDPTLLDRTRPGKKPPNHRRKGATKGLPDTTAYLKLDDWREEVFERDFSDQTQFDAEAILPNTLIADIVSSPLTYLLAKDGLEKQLRTSWLWWGKYGATLLKFVEELDIVFTPLPKKGTATHTTPSRSNQPAAEKQNKRPAHVLDTDDGPTARPPVGNESTSKRARTGVAATTSHRSGTLSEAERAPYVYTSQFQRPSTISYSSQQTQITSTSAVPYTPTAAASTIAFTPPGPSYHSPYAWSSAQYPPTQYAGPPTHTPYMYASPSSLGQTPSYPHPASSAPANTPSLSPSPYPRTPAPFARQVVASTTPPPSHHLTGTQYYQPAMGPQDLQTPVHPSSAVAGGFNHYYRPGVWPPYADMPGGGNVGTRDELPR